MGLGKRISVLRKENGFTQEQLAERIGVTRQAVSKWELEQSTPDIDCLNHISEIFNVSTDFLIKGQVDTSVIKSEDKSEIETKVHKKTKFSSLCIIGMLVSIIGVLLLIIVIVSGMQMDDATIFMTIPQLLMIVLWSISIILTGVELIVVKKHPRIGVLCMIISIVSIVLFIFVVPAIANAIEIEKGDFGIRRIYGFNSDVYNISYIINNIIVMIQGLVIGFEKDKLWNIVLSALSMLIIVYVILVGQWHICLNLVPGLFFLSVSIFMSINYYLDKK